MPSGGILLGTGSSFNTPSLGATTTYYVTDTTCTAPRTPITVTVLANSSANISVSTCSTYTSPSGHVWTQSGSYTDTIANFGGCDSILNIQLTVLTSSSSHLSVTTCAATYSLNSQTYSQSGIYSQSLTNAQGCDSTLTLNLTLLQPSASSLVASTCSTYLSPSGQLWTQSGTYLDTLPNSIGCDSVITVNLTINPPVTAFLVNASPTLTAQPAGASYQWIFCDSVSIVGATAQSFTATLPGSYAVIVIQNGCSDTSGCESIVLNAIFTPHMLSMSLHPNPSIGTATVDWGIPLTGQLWIMDAQGQIVFRRRVHQERSLRLQMDLASGLYLIELRDEWGNHATTRMIHE